MARPSPATFALAAAVLAGCDEAGSVVPRSLPPPGSYGDFGAQAIATLQASFYSSGQWSACDGDGCGFGNEDWGDDSLTYTLFLRWRATEDPTLEPMFVALTGTATDWGPCTGPSCTGWSDVPSWDSIADEREYEVTGDPHALDLARSAYSRVRDSDAYALGACPQVRYQHAFGGGGGLKTLETDSNLLKAALLLWKATGEPALLADAMTLYASVRTYFLDPVLPLYTVYVIDDGKSCTQLPHRFFASVNGNMIWSGRALAEATGDASYLADAEATAHAVTGSLADGRGVFADLQAENDVVEPLVEAFDDLAVLEQDAPAREWVFTNAVAAIRNARISDGAYGRFFDGPPPAATVTIWQTNGGLAVAIAAAALAPTTAVPEGDGWGSAKSTADDLTLLPSSVAFTGSGIALVGTLGEDCCEPGHASVLLDGQPTVDATGIWQNKSSAGRSFPGAVLFAWRWPVSGSHVVGLEVPDTNVKEGGPFVHIQSYVVLP
jgi:hypothetical protein